MNAVSLAHGSSMQSEIVESFLPIARCCCMHVLTINLGQVLVLDFLKNIVRSHPAGADV